MSKINVFVTDYEESLQDEDSLTAYHYDENKMYIATAVSRDPHHVTLKGGLNALNYLGELFEDYSNNRSGYDDEHWQHLVSNEYGLDLIVGA